MTEWLGFFNNFLPVFLSGVVITIKLTAVGLAMGFVIGLMAALARVYGGRYLKGVSIIYIELFRGTPLLVQLFLIYFGLPDLGITLDRMTAAYIAMSLNSGAYQAEYLRGAIQSIGSGQMMAARAIGLKRSQAIWNIILPQALRMVIPAWSNEPVSLLKSSAVAFLIAVPDLMTQAKSIAAQTYDPIGTYLAAGVVYLVLVFILAAIIGVIEKKVRIPGLELETQRR
jgi:polar amino acid transport system permease protein